MIIDNIYIRSIELIQLILLYHLTSEEVKKLWPPACKIQNKTDIMQILNPPSSLRLISTIYAASVSVGRLRLIIIVIQLAQKCRAVTIMLNACI